MIQNYHEDVNDIPEGYRCQLGPSGGCGKVNSCNRSSFITQVKDVLVIHLGIIRYDSIGGARKYTPNLTIDKTLDIHGKYNLQAIIWHHGGNRPSHGHYTAMVKNNDQWTHMTVSYTHLRAHEP